MEITPYSIESRTRKYVEGYRLLSFAKKFKNNYDDQVMMIQQEIHLIDITSFVEIKDFNALIDNKEFFDQAVNNKEELYEKLVEMSRNDDYTTRNLLNYLFHQNYYKVISTDLSRQANASIPHLIKFAGKLEKDDGAIIFFIAEK